MFRHLKMKVFATLAFVHFGFFFSLYGLFQLYRDTGATPQFHNYFPYLFAGFCMTYGAVMAGIYAIYAPLAPWARRLRSFRAFKSWFLEELPTIIAVITSMAALIPVLRAAWGELRKAQENGKLDFKRFGQVARKVADKAEHMFHQNQPHDHDHHEPDHPTENGRDYKPKKAA